MSHLYDTIEPNVISEDLLRKCVSEQGPQGEVGRVANAEGIDFTEVVQLRLDFKNILRVENLWQFKNLKKLQLDNNIIEDIVGLDTLTQLEWLDLSFNNIEVISGLSKLVNLKDLSLANNRIHCIDNLDSLVNSLQVLSLANNLINDIKNVEYFRRFRKLQALSLKGNPLSLADNYRAYVTAYIPSLVYADFRIIMKEERDAAREAFADVLMELEMQEREDERRKEAELAAQEEQQLLSSAYVDGLQGLTLFDALFKEDADASRIKLLPDVPEMLETYRKEFIACCEELSKIGLEEKVKRDKELASFKAAHKDACKKNQELSVEKFKEYEAAKQKLLVSKDGVEKAKAILRELQHDLMWLEMQLVEQLDEISKDFELNYGDMVGTFKESIQSHMTQLRELENKHHEEVTEIALSILEQFSKSKLDEELHDDLRTLLVDKDTLVSALNTSHDTHLLVVDNKEDVMAQRANKDLNIILSDIQSSEHARNRKKVAEIVQYIEKEKAEVKA